MTSDKFKTKKGRLTPYALACGYIEEKNVIGSEETNVTLWHEGGPYYHVRAHDRAEHKRLFWESFEKLTDARRCFDRAVKGAILSHREEGV